MKHLKRLLNGITTYTVIASFLVIILLVVKLTANFYWWKYRDTTLEILLTLFVVYLTGLLVEIF